MYAIRSYYAFVYMHCHECHMVVGEEFPVVAMAEPPFVELGADQGPRVEELCESRSVAYRLHSDLEAHARVLEIRNG